MAEEHANRLLPDSSRMNSYFENHKNSGARPGNPVGHRIFARIKPRFLRM
jgi:hypothetical protein